MNNINAKNAEVCKLCFANLGIILNERDGNAMRRDEK